MVFEPEIGEKLRDLEERAEKKILERKDPLMTEFIEREITKKEIEIMAIRKVIKIALQILVVLILIFTLWMVKK